MAKSAKLTAWVVWSVGGLVLPASARAGTCDALSDGALARPEHDAAVWPALWACAEEEYTRVRTGCVAASAPRSPEADEGWAARPEVAAGPGRAGLAADREAAARDADRMAAEREAGLAAGTRDETLPGPELAADAAARLAAAPAPRPAPPAAEAPTCDVAGAARAADLYARVIAAVPEVDDQLDGDVLCTTWLRAAATRRWAGREDPAAALEVALGLYRGRCSEQFEELAGDAGFQALLVDAGRAAGTRRSAWVWIPEDPAGWTLDGQPLDEAPERAGQHDALAPGVHFVGREGEAGARVEVDVPEGGDLHFALRAEGVVVTTRPYAGEGEGWLVELVRGVEVGGVAGLGSLHGQGVGVFGASAEVELPKLPLRVGLGARVAMATEPWYLEEDLAVSRLGRFDLGLRWEPRREWVVRPSVAVAAFRETEVAWGVEPELGARVNLGGTSLRLGLGLPVAFTGEAPGVLGTLWLRPGLGVETRGAGR